MDNSKINVFQGMIVTSILKHLSVEGRRRVHCRRSHGFIIKMKGATEYSYDNKKLLLSEGQIMFMEKGSSYYVTEVTPGYSYIVNFDLPVSPGKNIEKLSLPAGADITPVAERMYRAWQKETVYGAVSLIYSILEKTLAGSGYLSQRDRQLLEPITAHLNENLCDCELDLEALYAKSGVSEVYIRRIFKRRYGLAPAAYVTKERVRLACQMLISSESKSISSIALAVGYRDALYFSRIFKKQTGISPTEYRRAHAEDLF